MSQLELSMRYFAYGSSTGEHDRMKDFNEVYERLNPEQRQAVDLIEGPVMVMAGPGTGKTQIMSVRIANILRQTDAQPHNILALTFTNAAAKNLQQRLLELIGPAAYSVKCSTFHSFCVGVIEENAEYFPVLPTIEEPVSALEKLALMEQIFDENEFTHLKNAKYPHMYVRDAISVISGYKREGHSPLSIRKLAEDELKALEQSDLPPYKRKPLQLQAEKNLDLAQVYSEYQRLMSERGWYDFEDLILWVRDALREHEDLRLIYQEKYQYFLVDEYQDTNEGQLQLVRELASFWGERANLFVVGDPHQSIYRFQGASLANTLSFLDHYPSAEVVRLTTGYRCGNKIYQAAAELISHNPQEIKDERLVGIGQALTHFEDKSGLIRLHQAVTPLSESLWIAQEIERLHKEKVPYSEMAVLYRKHCNADLLEEILTARQIPYQVNQAANILDNQVVLQILTLLNLISAIRSNQEAPLLLPVFQLPWFKLNQQDVLTLIRAASRSADYRGNPWDMLLDETAVARLNLQDPAALQEVQKKLIELQGLESTLPLSLLVEEILRQTGFYDWTQAKPLGTGDLIAVANFLRHLQFWSKRDARRNLSRFIRDVERMQEHKLSLSMDSLELETSAVTLTTAHQAKGKEWSQVFIIQTQDKVWGNLRSADKIKPLSGLIPYADLNKDELNEDERRLFYVSLTRAKDGVAISYSERDQSGDKTRELQPAQFLAEISPDLFQVTEPVPTAQVLDQLSQQFTSDKDRHPALDLDEEWLKSIVNNFAFSFTALQEFLHCPIGFFYRRLIRVPEYPAPPLAMGTAVHAAMEALYRHLNRENELLPVEKLFTVIDRQLKAYDFQEQQAMAISAKSKSIIAEYYQEHQSEFKPSLMIERFFGNQPDVVFEELPLVGKADRIDALDSASRAVRVVDYKTGNVHSRNHILGKTASSDGAMIRQLVFYRLLGDLDPTFNYKITEGEFIFLEKSKSNKYASERFTITDEQVDDLKELLREVKEDFYSLKFLEKKPCRDCDACRKLGFTHSAVEKHLSGLELESSTLPELAEA